MKSSNIKQKTLQNIFQEAKKENEVMKIPELNFMLALKKRNSFLSLVLNELSLLPFPFFKKEVLLSCEKRTFFNFFKQTTKVMEIPSYTHIISRTL